MTTEEILLLVDARRHAASGTGRAIRVAAELSMDQLAEAIGVTKPTIWRWEQRKHRPRGAAAIRWARLLADLSRTSATSR